MIWPWQNFTPAELACKDGAPFPLTPESRAFLDKLQALRSALGFPFRFSSVFRTPAYNRSIGGATGSAHILARAADIIVSGESALRLVTAASAFGFTGIGVSQKGPDGARFIHLDDLQPAAGRSRPTIWSY